MKLKSTLLASALVLAVSVGAAHAADTVTTQKVNADGSTTTTTTKTFYYYKDADQNNNGIIDSAEFPTYVYQRWDRDGDGFLSDEEWQLNTVRWYGNVPAAADNYKTYTYWDANHDGKIDPSEFTTQVSTTKLYSNWDVNSDSTLEGGEYATATFHLYDTNNDGQISVEEWKNAH